MPISMYRACVPVFRQMLDSLAAVLAKAEAHATSRKIEPDALLQARLFPDMFPLVRQVQQTRVQHKAPTLPLNDKFLLHRQPLVIRLPVTSGATRSILVSARPWPT